MNDTPKALFDKGIRIKVFKTYDGTYSAISVNLERRTAEGLPTRAAPRVEGAKTRAAALKAMCAKLM